MVLSRIEEVWLVASLCVSVHVLCWIVYATLSIAS